MNKKLKCLLAAVLAVIMLVGAAVAMPASAAESDDEQKPAQQVADEGEEIKPDPLESRNAIEEEIAEVSRKDDEQQPEEEDEFFQNEEEIVEEKEDADLSDTGTEPDLNADLKPYRENRYEDKIVLKWTPAKGVDGYRVYWKSLTVEGDTLKLLTTLSDRALYINNLKRGSKFYFEIKPYVMDGENIVEGKANPYTAASVPAPVRNFRLKSGGSAATVIKWTRTVGIDGYLLLRQYQGKWSEYQYLDADATEFKDTNVKAGQAYYYKILTYRKDDRGYIRSATTLLTTVCGLCAPADTGTISRGTRVYLKWRNIRYAHGYQIYYSTDKVTYKALAISNKNSFTTKKFPEGSTVTFRIRPYRDVGKAKTRVVGTYNQLEYKIIGCPYADEVGDTCIEVDIDAQKMFYYVYGEIYVATDVVTGNYGTADTPTGTYYINNMARNVSLVGEDYVSYVDYWIAFIGGSYGIHDASWRDEFGGNIYKGDGSHGCVNTPYWAVKKIYNHADVGTPVVIHD